MKIKNRQKEKKYYHLPIASFCFRLNANRFEQLRAESAIAYQQPAWMDSNPATIMPIYRGSQGLVFASLNARKGWDLFGSFSKPADIDLTAAEEY